MSRRVLGMAIPTAILAALAAAAAAQDFERVEIETTDLGGGVFLLIGRGGNLAVSTGADGAILVDDQFAPLTERILAAVNALGGGPVRFVLNTHWQGDHTGGNENLGGRGVLIVAHENVRERMGTEQFMAAFGRRVPPAPAGALPVVTFSDRLTLHWNGQEIRVVHVAPAHTDGDSLVHFRSANVLHMGDTFFGGMYPFIDLSSGGSIEGVIAAAEAGLALADDKTRIIPGHGPLADRADLASYRDMLVRVRDRVAAARAEGRDEAAVVAARPSADLDEEWSRGFVKPDDFVRTVYRSLAATRTDP
ncbi:MAG: MBL fold metallo-hydrolase [Proteobacteria bacterium]|nr:MBL fold metallo-hydrolase [Pseudomonadota bacterium]